MSKKSILVLVGVALFVFGCHKVLATDPGGDYPSENDPFWNVMESMDSPNDTAGCEPAAATIFEGEGMEAGQATTMASEMCADLANMDDQMQADMTTEGVETNLFDASDWHNIDNLYFKRTGYGKIQFSTTIDFMSYDFMSFMNNFREAMEMGRGMIALDSDLVADFKTLGATLTMYNVPDYRDPEILVDGERDIHGIVSALVYDRDAGTITFNAAHFTTFSVTENDQEADIFSWKAHKYETDSSCPMKLKLKIKGRHFERGAKVRIGNKKASSVKVVSSKRITAKFCLEELLDIKTGLKRQVKVINPGAEAGIADKKIDLRDFE